MPDEKRPYRMKRRAELERETRLRITESAVELHGTLGPSRTSVSAVAERAGVRRSTVYRHFPDDAALFEACSSHWQAANPPPRPAAWAAIEDPAERLGTAGGHHRHVGAVTDDEGGTRRHRGARRLGGGCGHRRRAGRHEAEAEQAQGDADGTHEPA